MLSALLAKLPIGSTGFIVIGIVSVLVLIWMIYIVFFSDYGILGTILGAVGAFACAALIYGSFQGWKIATTAEELASLEGMVRPEDVMGMGVGMGQQMLGQGLNQFQQMGQQMMQPMQQYPNPIQMMQQYQPSQPIQQPQMQQYQPMMGLQPQMPM